MQYTPRGIRCQEQNAAIQKISQLPCYNARMNAEDIDRMEAGRHLDALVAEKVMGWKWRACPNTFEPGRPWRRWLTEPDRNLPLWDGVTEMAVDGLDDEESNVPEYSTDICAA